MQEADMIGVRDRMKLYEEDCQRKKKEAEKKEKLQVQKLDDLMTDITRFDGPKDVERREKPKVQKLDESITDVTSYQSPTRKSKKFYDPATIGKVQSPGVFQFSPGGDDDPLGFAKKSREKKAHMKSLPPGIMLCEMTFDSDDDDDDDDKDDKDEEGVSKPMNNMRPGMMRGCSFDEDGPPREDSSPRVNSMRPDTMGGASFDGGNDAPEKPQKVKNAEANKAKVELVELLYQDSKQGKGATVHHHLKSFSSLRNKYIISIDKLRPQSKPFLEQTEDDCNKEAEKVKKYDSLKKAWKTYKVTAQDKPDPGDDADSKPLYSMRPGMTRGTSFNSDGDDDDDGDAVSKPVSSMRPGMTRGKSFDSDGDDNDGGAFSKPVSSMRPGMTRGKSFDSDGDDNDSDAVSKPVNSMRPGMTRGKSFDSDGDDGDDDAPRKSQKVKDAEEKKAKVELVDLLDQESKQGKGATVHLKSFSLIRNGYINTINILRPQSEPILAQTKDERKKEAEKVKTYDNLKNAWETYEDTAQDKPDPENLTPEEEAAEEKLIEVETAVNGDWQDYAKEVVKAVQNNDGSDDGSDDDSERDGEWAFWILEAKRFKAEAERKKAKEEKKRKKKEKKRKKKEKEKKRNRKEKEAQRKSLEAEVGVQKREVAKTKNTSGDAVKEKEVVVGSSEEARRRERVFSLYSHLSTPTRSEFKQQVGALYSFSMSPDDIGPDDVDLLPWNETGSLVNITKMNALTRASIMKPKQ
jgi:hypothetical protein